MSDLNKNNSEGLSEEVDILFEKKYDRERLEEWKKLMPMPEISKSKKKHKRSVWFLIAGIALLLLSGLMYLRLQSSPEKLANEYLHSTVLASLEDSSLRGEGNTNENILKTKFYTAVETIKSSDKEIKEASVLLKEVSSTKNQFQMEALWFKALGHIKTGDYQKGKHDLEKLISISNYQNNKAKILLEKIK